MEENSMKKKYKRALAAALAALCLLMGLFPEVLLDVIGKAVIHP